MSARRSDARWYRVPMAGAIAARGRMTDRLTLGYREAVTTALTPLGRPGTRLRGHEFHYPTVIEQPDQPLAHVTDANGAAVAETGSRRGHASGTYFHLIGVAT